MSLKEAIEQNKLKKEEKELTPSYLRSLIRVVTEKVELLWSKLNSGELKGDPGNDGKDGADGKDGESIVGPKGKDGIDGKNGKDGKDGKEGPKGKDGKDGKSGKNGKDGTDGKDGKNGSPDTPKQIATKLNTLTNAVDAKVIKGLEKYIKSTTITKIVRNFGGGGASFFKKLKDVPQSYSGQASKVVTVKADETGLEFVTPQSIEDVHWGEIQGTLSDQADLQTALNAKLGETYESISKNLKSYPYAFNKTGDVLDSITYTLPSGTITKTFNRTGTVLNTVVLSGDTPAGIDLTKTFNYTGSELTSITYS